MNITSAKIAQYTTDNRKVMSHTMRMVNAIQKVVLIKEVSTLTRITHAQPIRLLKKIYMQLEQRVDQIEGRSSVRSSARIP